MINRVLAILSTVVVVALSLDARVAWMQNVFKHRYLTELLENEALEVAESKEFTINHVLSVLSATELVEISTECKEDLDLIIEALNNPTAHKDFVRFVLAKILDSSGKKSPAILRGHFHFAGHYSECAQIEYKVDERERTFKGAYFRTNLDPLLRPNSGNDSCTLDLPSGKEFDVFWRVDFCLPASCSSAELISVFRPDSGTTIDNPVCQFTKPGDLTPEINAGFYITLSIMGLIVTICIVSGLVEFYFDENLSNTTFNQSLGWKLFMSFSLYSNIASIFDVSQSAKEGQISPINCIRFFSMVWVLLSHLLINFINIVANPIDVYELARDITSEAILNAYFAVDSFFLHIRSAPNFSVIHVRQPKETMSIYGWIMFYVHRILRISPAFYMVVLFYSFVLKQIMRDTPLSSESSVSSDSCGTTWWLELLYVHNWVHDDCVGYSWYLASDMQIFLFTPLIIVPLAIKPILGLIVAAVIFTISTATNIFLVYHFHWPAEANWFHPKDPEETNMTNYNILMYDSPLIRCQIYIMGMVVGWFMQTKKKLKIHPIVYLSCWILGISLMLTVLLGLHDQTNGTVLSLFWRAMYSAFSRPAWGIGLSAIVMLCYYGYGGPINSFMAWHIWVPLGRLSYCAYLIHVPVIQLVLSLSTDEFYFSNFMEFFITRVVSITAVTFFFASFWSACFELSFGRIEKLLLGGVRAPPKSSEKLDETKDMEHIRL